MGKIIIIAGIILILIGIIIYCCGDKLSWIGNLPGDIKLEKGNFSFYFPITTMVLLSIILSLILKLIRRFL